MADQIDINLGGLKLITCDRSFTREVAQRIETFENSNFVLKLKLFILSRAEVYIKTGTFWIEIKVLKSKRF